MIKKIVNITLAIIVFSVLTASGQSESVSSADSLTVDSASRRLDIESRLQLMLDDMDAFALDVRSSKEEFELKSVEKDLAVVDILWNAYYTSKQTDIAADDSLMVLVTNYHAAKQDITDSIGVRRHIITSTLEFVEAYKFIMAQDTVYKKFNVQATKYALVKKAAPLLEKLKAKEQLIFADIEARYESAKTISGEMPQFQSSMEIIEEQYITLKNVSEKIKAAEFKPFFQRIKDYLLGFAAVAMILMFFNMIISKFKAAKQVRENAKKMEKMMNGGDEEYPTI